MKVPLVSENCCFSSGSIFMANIWRASIHSKKSEDVVGWVFIGDVGIVNVIYLLIYKGNNMHGEFL